MSTIVLLVATGLGLGAIYFLVASGLSLIYGLMGVLNFAHGVFLSFGAFLGWEAAQRIGAQTWTGFAVSLLVGALAGAVFAALTERLLVQRLYNRHIEQVLVTVGLALAVVALFDGIWGTDPHFIRGQRPGWLEQVTGVLGAGIPNDRFVTVVVAVLVLVGIVLFLKRTRYGMIIRAGVENRSMVTALGIDVRTAFTLVFTIGGAAAGLGGVLASHHFGYVSPLLGQTLLIFAFIVTVIGGLGSLTGAAVAAVAVALLQQFANYYLGVGDFAVVVLLAVVLLTRPAGLLGRKVA
ncbi:MAG TPA: branched-chain amino acid ABC transporter permease [Ornithinicoccus sp.]|nr:branched-chain amino acid ABC transporter permease [Ornithinicoccus sp.]